MGATAVTDGIVTGSVRLWLRAEALSVVVMSLLFYARLGLHWWIFFALLLVPDLSMLGYLINPRVGATAYNVVHSYFVPLALAAGAMANGRNNFLPFFCIWMAHIGLDRSLGYGLKYPSAFLKTHLGILGKASAT